MAKKRGGKRKKQAKNTDAVLVVGVVFVVLVFILIAIREGEKNQGDDSVVTAPTTTLAPSIRKPAVAGSFYPNEPEALTAQIDNYLGQAPDFAQVYGIRGMVSPHAGYIYSGLTAAHGYRQLRGSRYETVIVLAASHRHRFRGASVADVDYYETPLGLVPVSHKVKEMLGEDVFVYEPKAHDREHSLEVQLPFLQRTLPPFKLVPIVTGDVDPRALAEAVLRYADDDTLIIASTDLSHYKPYDVARAVDSNTVEHIVGLEYEMLAKEGDCCGKIPTLVLMDIAERSGWRTKLFDLRNSGDTAGDKSGVVGYASVGMYDGLNEDEQEALIGIVEDTLNAHYRGEAYVVDATSLPPKLKEVKGCFVTLNKDRSLRGCIGHLQAREMLYECVRQNALSAALNDGRFQPVTAGELDEIKIEVSVLSDPKPLAYDSPDDLLAKLIPGVDGVILKNGRRQSTYLPVVWEQLPGKEQFLSRLCLKQGSPVNCWRTAEVYTYQAQEFHQEGFK